MTTLFEEAAWAGERRHHIEYRRKNHDIVCPEYACPESGSIIVIPDFLFLRRKYPAHVYIFAIDLYSSNPGMSQRAVAKATREKYALPTFSHSTLCRTFKALERSLADAGEAEAGDADAEVADAGHGGSGAASTVSAKEEAGTAPGTQKEPKRRFPTAADTAGRRKQVAAFIKRASGDSESAGIIEKSRSIVRYWHDKHRRLLI